MVPRERLAELLRVGSFRPFRVYLADGRAFDVLRRESTVVGKRTLWIGVSDGPSSEPFADQMVEVEYGTIDRVEPLEIDDRPPPPKRAMLRAHFSELFAQEPFRPTRLHLSNGEVYELWRKRDNRFWGDELVVLSVQGPDPASTCGEPIPVHLDEIERVERIEPATADIR